MCKVGLVFFCLLVHATAREIQSSAGAGSHAPARTHHSAEGDALKQLAKLILATKQPAAFNSLSPGVSHLQAVPRPVLMRGSCAELKKGQIVDGVVKSVMENVAFVDIGCEREAMLFNLDLSNKEDVPDLTLKLKVGQKMRSRAKRVDKESKRVKLSCLPVPSASLEDLSIGQPIEGLVTKIEPFGARVDIGAEIHAVLPIEEILGDNVRVDDPKQAIGERLPVGEVITGKISFVDSEADDLVLTVRDA